jgi:hypothetical protein
MKKHMCHAEFISASSKNEFIFNWIPLFNGMTRRVGGAIVGNLTAKVSLCKIFKNPIRPS